MATPSRWLLRRSPPLHLPGRDSGLHPLLIRVLCARGYADPEDWPALMATEGTLGDPFRLPDMDRAVSRLLEARQRGERVVVYGDFDTDGVTATVLLVEALNSLGIDTRPYIPDRFDEAYGLNKPALSRILDDGAAVVVTVDCGVRSVNEAQHCRQIGLDLIITDHHHVPDQLPDALAVVDPKRAVSQYPFDALAGVGVAYRLVEALYCRTSERCDLAGTEPGYARWLDLVALGTVSDMVPLVGENRHLAHIGLERMATTERLGLRALVDVAGCSAERMRSEDIAFRLGPRINAAGRLDHAMLAYRLLTSTSPQEAKGLANELDEANRRRRSLLEKQLAHAQEIVGDLDGQRLVFASHPDFHEGIVGLIASRLVEAHHLPALVMRCSDGHVRGSARSIEGLHITRALDECADLLTRYGGHERAAGFSLSATNLDAFHQRLLAFCRRELESEDLAPKVRVDAIVPLGDLDPVAVASLDALEPTGEENEPAKLATLDVVLHAMRTVGGEGQHLQMRVGQGRRVLKGIAFRLGHLAQDYGVGTHVDIVYRPVVSEWQGRRYVELFVEDMRPTATAG